MARSVFGKGRLDQYAEQIKCAEQRVGVEEEGRETDGKEPWTAGPGGEVYTT